MPKESTDFGAEITPGSSKETAGWAPKSKTHSIPEATKGHPFNSWLNTYVAHKGGRKVKSRNSRPQSTRSDQPFMRYGTIEHPFRAIPEAGCKETQRIHGNDSNIFFFVVGAECERWRTSRTRHNPHHEAAVAKVLLAMKTHLVLGTTLGTTAFDSVPFRSVGEIPTWLDEKAGNDRV